MRPPSAPLPNAGPPGPPPHPAAAGPLASIAALAVALAAAGTPAQAAIVRDDCLVEVPDRGPPQPPARKRGAPAPGARQILRVVAAAPAAGLPATMRKLPIDCPPRPLPELRARGRGLADTPDPSLGAGAHIA